ncbi:MAG: NADH-quinone oxidoreductase subunit NuoE, partial [Desulfobaccales bacterium]
MTTLTKNSGCACQKAAALSPEIIHQVDEIVNRHKDQAGALMPVLQEVQEAVGYLPPAVQERIAAGLNIQGSEVFGVMSFYSMYSWKPKGRYVVRMCESPPCHITGAENMLHALQQELGVAVGETTGDGLFTLELSACLGVCEVAPAMQINEVVIGNLTSAKIKQVL